MPESRSNKTKNKRRQATIRKVEIINKYPTEVNIPNPISVDSKVELKTENPIKVKIIGTEDEISQNATDYSLHIFGGIILTVIAFFYLGYIVINGNFFNYSFEVLKRNLGSLAANNLIMNLIGAFIFSIVIFILFSGLNLIFYKHFRKFKFLFIITIALMIGIFFLGYFSIDEIWGYKEIKLNLIDSYHPFFSPGTIECKGEENSFIGENLSCIFRNKSGIFIDYDFILLNLKLDNNSEINYQLRNGTDQFRAPQDLKYIYFQLIKKNDNLTDISQPYTVGYHYTFITSEDYEKNKQSFLTALFSLIILVLITIPTAIINFKKVWDAETNLGS
ncbi:MAG: hypothetical protein V1660_00020 [archaeon]